MSRRRSPDPVLIAFHILAGLALLVVGAELLTRGGASYAASKGVPPLMIGLTIVAVGTSTPELAVGIDAALKGNGALAVGNIAGTNTVNILLIMGLSALLLPLTLQLQTLRNELPAMIFAALMLLFMSADGMLTRIEGALLVTSGLVYTWLILRAVRREGSLVREEFEAQYGSGAGAANAVSPQPNANRNALFMLLAGIAIIVGGADWFVEGTVELARLWGVSDAFIGLTVVAIGTSSPELVTTLVSTLHGQRDIAIGNLLGSSVYNIFIILGVTCLVPASGVPVPPELFRVDIPVMVGVTLVCAPVFVTGRRVSRLEGGLFVMAYAAYLAMLIIMRTGG